MARDLEVTFSGVTSNDVTLILPQDTGVSVTVESDTNEVSAKGFTANGNTFTNDAFGATEVAIDITIEFERGQVTLE